jgi:heme-degrading monooxygenase HmoA
MQNPVSVFRIDKFAVPAAAMPDFLPRLHRIDGLLAGQPGCLRHFVLVASDASAEFNVLTLVEWADPQAMAAARSAVQSQYAKEGFDPAAFMRQLGVRADMGNFERP